MRSAAPPWARRSCPRCARSAPSRRARARAPRRRAGPRRGSGASIDRRPRAARAGRAGRAGTATAPSRRHACSAIAKSSPGGSAIAHARRRARRRARRAAAPTTPIELAVGERRPRVLERDPVRGRAAPARASHCSTCTRRKRMWQVACARDVSEPDWIADGDYADIRYERSREPGIAKITINRPGGPQRVSPADRDRALRRVHARPRGPDGRRRDPHRRGTRRVLLGRRPARARRHRLPERARRAWAASTSPTCTSRSAACPSRWSRWSPATRSAAATSCTSSAT